MMMTVMMVMQMIFRHILSILQPLLRLQQTLALTDLKRTIPGLHRIKLLLSLPELRRPQW